MRTETIEPNDIIIHQSHVYRVIAVSQYGHLARLDGRHMSPEVSTQKLVLVYKAADVPPNFQPGMLNPEQEAALLAVVAARNDKQGMDKEKDGDDIEQE